MRTTTYFGNPWIGMFIKTNDAISLLPIDTMKKVEDSLSANLGTTLVRLSISDSNLLGVYIALNSNGAILPNVARPEEVQKLKEAGLNVYISQEPQNAHGNNICANDKGGIVNPHIPRDEVLRMSDALGVELVPISIAGYSTVGSSCIATNSGYLAHFKASDDELAMLKDAFKVDGGRGTMNRGTGFVSYGAIVNRKGYVAGEASTAYELGRLEEALGLIR